MTTAVPPGKRQATSPGPTSQPREKAVVSVRVWDAPLRLMHWTLVLSIGVLSVTGVYLAHPFLSPAAGQGPGEPATAFTMGTMRAVHTTAGWVFTVVLLARIGWAFRGNRWARWDQPCRELPRADPPAAEVSVPYQQEPAKVHGDAPVAVLGLGNRLLTDEGAGVAAAEEIASLGLTGTDVLMPGRPQEDTS